MNRARIVGERVYLRPLERSDLTEEYLGWMNDPSIHPLLANRFPVNRDSLERYFVESQATSSVLFAICDRASDRHVGNARLSHLDWVHRVALFGWILGSAEHRGRGLGTEALRLLLLYGFHELGLNRIWSAILTTNLASLRSCEKVGMRSEGILRQFFYGGGQFQDAVSMAILREDYDRMQGGGGDPTAGRPRT